MQTITLEINDQRALEKIEALRKKKLVTVITKTTYDSPALEGEPFSMKAFKEWISGAETDNSISLKDAKTKWQQKKKALQKNLR